jgi:hypothetical protein
MLINRRNALMAGKRKPTAKDYVQDGLVAMWDGIENAGWGVHDPNYLRIDNLAGTAIPPLDLPRENWDLTDKFAVSKEAVGFMATYPSQSWYEENMMAEGYTLELVMGGITTTTTDPALGSVAQACGIVYGGSNLFGTTAKNQFQGKGISTGLLWVRPFSPGTGLHSFTQSVMYSTRNIARFDDIYDTRNNVGGIAGTQYYNYGRNRINIGQDYSGASKQLAGWKFACARLYSRALTADEIARNYNIDKARFGLP